jgi:hypothetical protein
MRQILGTLLLASMFACGGSDTNHYRTARSIEEKCCDKVSTADGRQQCRDEIPVLADSSLEQNRLNQETFECVAEYFVCDPATGRATQPSAQAQLDCLNDLQSTQQ